MTSQEQVPKKRRRTVHSISFNDEDRKIIQLAAQQEGVSFASFLKNATKAYIKESLEYQRLADTGELKETDKPIAEVISDFKDAIGKTIVSVNDNNSEKLRKIQWMIETIIFILLLFNPPLSGPDEQVDAIVKLANQRTKKVMEEYKCK